MTIGDKFDEVADLYGDNEALVVVHQNIRWTYRELKKKVDDCAKALIACGLEKGDRAGIWAPNRYEWTVLQFATAKVGVIMVNINPSYRKHEVKYALNQSGCKLLVLAEQFKTSHYTEMILELAPELENSSFGKLESQDLPELKMAVALSKDPAKGFLSWDGFIEKSIESTEDELELRQKALAFDEAINLSLIHISEPTRPY